MKIKVPLGDPAKLVVLVTPPPPKPQETSEEYRRRLIALGVIEIKEDSESDQKKIP